MIHTHALAEIGDAAEAAGNFAFARQVFERGAELGDLTCLTRLAYMLDVGLGVPCDKRQAMRLYQRAWRQHRCSIAANNIAILYRERANRRAMFQWFRRGATTGDGDAMVEVAKCCLNGVGVR